MTVWVSVQNFVILGQTALDIFDGLISLSNERANMTKAYRIRKAETPFEAFQAFLKR